MGKDKDESKKKEMPVVAGAVKKTNKLPPDREKYPADELIANARELFGVMPEVVIGALHGRADGFYTKETVCRLVQQFKKRKVK